MEPNQENNTTNMESVPDQNTQENSTEGGKSVGPAIGIIIIIALLVIGGLYFWGQNVDNGPQDILEDEQATMNSEAETEALQTQGQSDDLSSIEADLNATNVDGLGSELDSAEAGFEAQ